MIAPYVSQQPVDDFGLRFADLKYAALIPGSPEALFTVPGFEKRYKIIIKVEPNAIMWCALNKTAVIPTSGSFTSSDSELVSGQYVFCREVVVGDVLHFVSAAPVLVSISLYSWCGNN